MGKSESELKDLYGQAKDKIKEGEYYAHYKHPGEALYQIVSVALIHSTLQPVVIYEHLPSGVRMARTFEEFLEQVEVNGEMVDRFSRVS